jgi:hypothetical protein
MLGDSTVGTSIVAELRAYSSGALLTTMSVLTVGGGVSLRTLTPDTPAILDPNTIYALVIGASGAGSFHWRYAESNNKTGPGKLPEFSYSTDQGATWADYGTAEPYLIQVNVNLAQTGVPEPSTTALSVSALIAIAICRLKLPGVKRLIRSPANSHAGV